MLSVGWVAIIELFQYIFFLQAGFVPIETKNIFVKEKKKERKKESKHGVIVSDNFDGNLRIGVFGIESSNNR